MSFSRSLTLLVFLTAACGGETGTSNGELARAAQAAPPIIAPLATPYRETPVAPVYEDGVKTVTLKGATIAQEFQQLVEAYVQRTYRDRAANDGDTSERSAVPERDAGDAGIPGHNDTNAASTRGADGALASIRVRVAG